MEWKSHASGYGGSVEIGGAFKVSVGRKMVAKGEPAVYRFTINGVTFKKEYADMEECKRDALKKALSIATQASAVLDLMVSELC